MQEETKVTETTTTEEHFDINEVDRLMEVVNSEVIKKDFIEAQNTIKEQKDSMLDKLAGLTQDKQFILDRLDKYQTLEDLKVALRTDNDVIKFFTNEKGEEMELTHMNMDKNRSIAFRRDLLIYLKTSDIESAKIDAEYEKLEKATSEFQTEIDDACLRLSDNVLAYAGQLRDKAEVETNSSLKAKMMRSVVALESAFYLTMYNDILDKYPSITKKVVSEMTDTVKLAEWGKRYMSKLEYTLLKKDRSTKVSLIPYLSDPEISKLSFEETVLLKDDYTTSPDLFVFSLIRFFAMADWNDPSIRQAHATVILVIRKLTSNELDEDLTPIVKENIKKYLARFA